MVSRQQQLTYRQSDLKINAKLSNNFKGLLLSFCARTVTSLAASSTSKEIAERDLERKGKIYVHVELK